MPVPTLQAGALNRRIAIEVRSVASDGTGTQSFTPLYQCWASIRAASGRDVYAASGFVEQISHVVTIRYPAVMLKAGMQVLYESRIFKIQAVTDPDEGRKQLTLLCLEVL